MEKDNEQYELIVSEGRRPFLMLIFAACFFTYMLYNLYYAVIIFYNLGFTEKSITIIPDIISVATYGLAGGITFSVNKTILIDTDEDLLIKRYCIGPFSKDVKSKVPQLEYISVFLDAKENFQVNLWYVGNKHYNMYAFDEKESAMKFGELSANKLNIDLLDATEKGNSKWIEKS